jgi:hypothetical protein
MYFLSFLATWSSVFFCKIGFFSLMNRSLIRSNRELLIFTPSIVLLPYSELFAPKTLRLCSTSVDYA